MTNIPTIRVLSERTIKKIKAGEVIENPASVVKELVENSLDAGATEICVEIKSGGRELIRVTDNGCGMTEEDALLCLELHATSKISEVEDIQDLSTMGFRGEAIPSIASISKFTLITCPQGKSADQATLLRVEANKILSCSPAARSPGTTIEVKSLFYNVPVRRNFQRSPSYDIQEVNKRMALFALAYPHIQFTLISDEKSLLNTRIDPSENALATRVEATLGKDFFTALKSVSLHKDPYHIEGFVGDPSFTRTQKTGQYLFINRRAILSPFVSFAVKEAYGTMLPSNRYPLFVLYLEMPGTLVDVNVHPQKKEVRLREESRLKTMIIEAVQAALRQDQFEFTPAPQPLYKDSFNLEVPAVKESPTPFRWDPTEKFKPITTPPPTFSLESSPIKPTPPPSLSASPNLFEFTPSSATRKIPKIWTTLSGYILVDPQFFDKSEGLCLVDQRAASFRIQYERLSKQKIEEEVQLLLVPLTIDLPSSECQLLKDHLPFFHKMGLHIDEFGAHTFAIHAIPISLKSTDIKSFIFDLIHDFQDLGDNKHFERAEEKRLLLAANRLALPSNKRLSFEEAQNLLFQLNQCESSLHCPKGSDIITYIPINQFSRLRSYHE
jgi:DNA mismatch repair protein MutL